MKHTGTMVFDPVARATGPEYTRRLHKHAHELHACTRALTPFLQGRWRRIANGLDRQAAADPHLWLRQTHTTDGNIHQLWTLAKHCVHNQDFPARVEPFTDMLYQLCVKTEKRLLLSDQRKHWAILKVDEAVAARFITKLRARGVRITHSLWGPHISIVRGERPKKNWRDANHLQVEFEITSEPRNKGKHWWVNVRSEQLEQIRIDMGLSPRPPKPFHLTLGTRQ